MAHGRVFLAGSEHDPLVLWLRARLQEAGYWPQSPAMGREAIYGSVAAALPVVAGLDIGHDLSEQRSEQLAAIDAQMPPGAPFLVLCTAVHVDTIAALVTRRMRLVGWSLLGAPGDQALAEIVPATAANQEAPRRAALFLGSLGFHTETLPPGSWPVAPRVVACVVNEAALLLAEGTSSAADIDLAMRVGGGLEQGPLALADTIGLDLILAVLETLQREQGGERYRPAPLLRKLVRAGRTGRAAGHGFHLYAGMG